MINTVYTVWETNSKLAEIRNYYIGENIDIAETIAFNKYTASGNKKDFLITMREEGSETKIYGVMLSEESQKHWELNG